MKRLTRLLPMAAGIDIRRAVQGAEKMENDMTRMFRILGKEMNANEKCSVDPRRGGVPERGL